MTSSTSTAFVTEAMIKHGLAFKLNRVILTTTAIIFLTAFGYTYLYSRDQILRDTQANAAILTLATINKIETTLNGIEIVPTYLARTLATQEPGDLALQKEVEDFLSTNPEIYGSATAFEPYAFDGKTLYHAPYIFRDNNRLKRISLGSAQYDYFHLDWYQVPKELGRAVWSEPYFDEGGGNIAMATYSVPFYRYVNKKRTFSGVVTADISLDWLLEIVKKLIPEQTGYAFLVSRNGVFVIHPNKAYILRESVFSIAEAQHNPELRRIGRHMTRGGEGFVSLSRNYANEKVWLYYAPLPSLGWSMGIVFPEDVLFAEIHKLNRVKLVIGTAGLSILFFAIVFISGKVTRPLRNLAETTKEIARGNLDLDVPPIASKDEVGELTRSFRDMQSALKEYITNLAETTAAKERIESELKIAHSIQMSFLPKKFPPFPERKEFEIYATLEPAREVGGDLYDFFLLDDEHLFFSIGDVSGKGVPAALFMAVTKTLIKGIGSTPGIQPSDILNAVNAELCIDNESCMFVTMFCGILNFKTGELAFTNAGHNPPVLMPVEGVHRWLEVPPGFILGIMEDESFDTVSITLKPGEALLLYTDGITEAMNGEKQLFSDAALLEAIHSCQSSTLEGLISHIMTSVKRFAGDEPQSDDITVLALRYRGLEI
ncbi:sigma-B regulation protein RsbU (phosphoserine phosphatase) [Syntrophus gentianae]|uniref:Sigma-B regulation protein RsbU (Phosphoserine phosphatase) n=2 Tax=Syntrophus gentianae TaxID=43775 RepID=A0A1H7U8I4_9BACT|nr:sigma-B regulation protein RsbU (phosphoserine phosphatase) [Syntrophus gentianae]